MFLTSTRIKFKHFEIQYKYIRPLWNFYVDFILGFRLKRKCKTLREKKTIKVGFLVAELQKWKYEVLYKKMIQDPRFSPVIIAYENSNNGLYMPNAQEVYDYFIKLGYEVILAYNYETRKYLDILELKNKVDILIYQQPWALTMQYNPFNTSKYFLTVSSSYGYNITKNYEVSYTAYFHKFVDICFTETDVTKHAILNNIKNVRAQTLKTVGCLFFDYYKLTDYKKEFKKKIIIYAPHHPGDYTLIKISTFTENAIQILEMAKKYPDYVWVYKPHPSLMNNVVKMNIFSLTQYQCYLKEWSKIGFVHTTPDYYNLFANSECLITDSCGFLMEYFPTNKPIIHLRKRQSNFADFSDEYLSTFYSITDFSQLENLFNEVVINKNDYKKQDRKRLTLSLLKDKSLTSDNMINVIFDTINHN